MKNFLLLLILAGLLACSEKTQETQSEAYIPEMVISDSLVIDRLTRPNLLDDKNDKSEFLFYDFKASEFFGSVSIDIGWLQEAENSNKVVG